MGLVPEHVRNSSKLNGLYWSIIIFQPKVAVNWWYTNLIFEQTHIVTCDAANTCGFAQQKTNKSENFRVFQSRGLASSGAAIFRPLKAGQRWAGLN